MSVQQDRLTFFGVLAAVTIVVLGYLQLGRLYPVAGREGVPTDQAQQGEGDGTQGGVKEMSTPLEGDSQP